MARKGDKNWKRQFYLRKDATADDETNGKVLFDVRSGSASASSPSDDVAFVGAVYRSGVMETEPKFSYSTTTGVFTVESQGGYSVTSGDAVMVTLTFV